MIMLLKHKAWAKNALILCAFMAVLCVLSGCRGLKADASVQEQWVSSVQNCWPCVMYKAVFDAIQNMIMNLYPTMAARGLMVMAVGILFWLAFTTGKMLTSLYEPNLKEYFHNVMVVLFKALVVSSILISGDNFLCVLDMIVSPVIELFAELSRIVLTANSAINDGINWPNEYLNPVKEGCNMFSGRVVFQLQDIIFRVYVALNSGISLGYYVMVEKSFLNWIIGPFIMYMFFIMSLIFPLMFIDSFIRLGAVLVLGPFFLAAWVFPSTKGAVKKAWDVIFGSMFQILMASIYIGLVVGVIHLFETNNWPGMLGGSRQTSDPNMLAQMRRLATEALSFFALIIIMNRMQNNIPAIAGYFGGDSIKSEAVALLNGVKQLAISATMIAVGAALSAFGLPAGAAMMKAGASRMADQMRETAEGAIAETMNTGEGTGASSDPATNSGALSATLGAFTEGDSSSGGGRGSSGNGNDSSGGENQSSSGSNQGGDSSKGGDGRSSGS